MKFLNVILAVSLTLTSVSFAVEASNGSEVMTQSNVAIDLATSLKIEGRAAQKMALEALDLMSVEQRKIFLAQTLDNIVKLQTLLRSEQSSLQDALDKALANNSQHITYNIISHPMFYLVDAVSGVAGAIVWGVNDSGSMAVKLGRGVFFANVAIFVFSGFTAGFGFTEVKFENKNIEAYQRSLAIIDGHLQMESSIVNALKVRYGVE